MSGIYRKSAIEKLSSPEQLDEMITIIPPSFWVASVSALTILFAVLIWSIFSRIPVKLSTEGIYMDREGVHAVYSETQGVVEELCVKEGDKVSKGDVLVRLSTREIDKKLAEAQERVQKVESVTLQSTGDEVIEENKELLNMKSQLLTLEDTLSSTEKMLALRQNELASQRDKTNAAQDKMQSARNLYYQWMNTGSNTSERLSLDSAQTELNRVRNDYDTAKATLENFNAKNNENIEYLKGKMLRLENDLIELREAGAEEEAIRKAEEAIFSAKLEYDTINDQKAQYERTYEEWSEKLKAAEDNYYNRTFNYINAENTMLHSQTYESQLTDDYNVALNNYNTELSKLRSLEDATAQLTVQLSADELGTTNKYEALKVQFDAQRSSALDGLKKQIEDYKKQIEKSSLKSSLDGYVISMDLVQGSAVTDGTPVCTVSNEPPSSKNEEMVILYAQASEGKKIKPGMKVMVYPGTVNKQEYGHMEAQVKQVSLYIASTGEVTNQLGENTLVQKFLKQGPIVSAACELRTDENTVSGYYWSSKKGASVDLDAGTLVTADVVTEEKAPITMLLPMIKEKLTVDKTKLLEEQQVQ